MTGLIDAEGEVMTIAHATRRAALITGAAGKIGSRVVEHLAQQHKSVIGLYRNKLPASHKNVLPLCCDLLNPEAVVAPLKSTDTVIHLAWQGGILGSSSKTSSSSDGIQHADNVVLTANIVKAMERANARKIILLSWVGVDRKSPNAMLREKYWAENIVINSAIPEKIILRAGVIGGCGVDGEFFKAANPVTRMPLLLPLPRQADGLVLTTISDILWAIDEALRVSSQKDQYCRIVDLTSTTPSSAADLVRAIDCKVRGKKRLTVGGYLGDVLFHWSERKFGAAKTGEPRLTDFFAPSRLSGKTPAEGIPPTTTGLQIGHKVDINSAL
jgi:nucleoside-diphosphate-sugar epimerase